MHFEPNEQGLIPGKNPVIIGHKTTGYVVETSSGVSGFKEGDKVGFICAVGYCFECEPCKKVHNSWCDRKAEDAGLFVQWLFPRVCVRGCQEHDGIA